MTLRRDNDMGAKTYDETLLFLRDWRVTLGNARELRDYPSADLNPDALRDYIATEAPVEFA